MVKGIQNTEALLSMCLDIEIFVNNSRKGCRQVKIVLTRPAGLRDTQNTSAMFLWVVSVSGKMSFY